MIEISKTCYEKVIKEDIEWLKKNTPNCLDREHIIEVLNDSTNWIFKKLPNSEKCKHRIVKELDNDGERIIVGICKPCAGKGCISMFGTDLCRYHYEELTEK